MSILQKKLKQAVFSAYREKRRLVAPLMGFPGLVLTRGSIKLAQQNYGEHYKVIQSLAERFAPDLIFPLMDLAVEANALGQYTVFPKDDSATVIKDRFDISELERRRQINISFDTRLLGYIETLRLMSIGLPPHIFRGAYVIGPYTLAALIMGADEAAICTITRVDLLTELCQFTTEIIQQYIRLLIAAGTQVICILEPSAVMLGPAQFEQFSANYVHHINNSCKYTEVTTIYHTCGNTSHLIEQMVNAGIDGISLDSPEAGIRLPEIARHVREDIIILGNINPTRTILKGSAEEVEGEVQALLKAMDPYPNFVLSTGCDLPQETPLENIRAFMQAGRNHRIAS